MNGAVSTPGRVLRLSLLICILPPVFLAWYFQASSLSSLETATTSASLTSFFLSAMGGWEKRHQRLSSELRRNGDDDDDDDNSNPLRYDWQRLFQEQQSYYSKVVSHNKNMGNNPNKTIHDINDDDDQHTTTTTTTMVHVIVLAHGLMGNPLEMNSIKESLESAIEQISTEGNIQNVPYRDGSIDHQFVVHSAVCNHGKTNDGIHAGGSRLANEINSLLRFVVQDNPPSHSNNNYKMFTLSICGNSLGGLYARRALANIEWNVTYNIDKDNNENVENDAQQPSSSSSSSTTTTTTSNFITPVTPLLFVTTATPHLGVSQHTYIRLPRAFEYPIAQILDQTGRDLFGYSNVLEDLTMQEMYIQPLQRFQQRIAYANVYGTDFQVPTPTAAFWTRHSDSPHYVVRNYDIMTNEKKDDVNEHGEKITSKASHTMTPPNMIVMTLTTPQRPPQPNNTCNNDNDDGDDDDDEDDEKQKDPMQRRFRLWSQQLDCLGWTKVLVDMREHVPQVSVWSSLSSSSSSSTSDDEGDTSTSDDQHQHQKSGSNKDNNDNNKTVWTAHELLQEYGRVVVVADGGVMRIPLGHFVMVANAKDKLNKWLTIGGKPVMDWLARSMIQTLRRQDASVVINKTTNEES
jgi:hypothetical protein